MSEGTESKDRDIAARMNIGRDIHWDCKEDESVEFTVRDREFFLKRCRPHDPGPSRTGGLSLVHEHTKIYETEMRTTRHRIIIQVPGMRTK
jgi:hypothetical protein